MPRLALLAALTTFAASVGADILHLRDGGRYYGDVVSETRDEIEFRIFGGASDEIGRAHV